MAEATKFKLGDTVRLKSGGPLMTIVRENDDGGWNCAWFSQAAGLVPTVQSHAFPTAVLIEVDSMPDMPERSREVRK